MDQSVCVGQRISLANASGDVKLQTDRRRRARSAGRAVLAPKRRNGAVYHLSHGEETSAMGIEHGHTPSRPESWLAETSTSLPFDPAASSQSSESDQSAEGGSTVSRSPDPATGPPSPQTRYEHYEIQRREDGTLWSLGRGSMGETFKAIDTRLRCAVALKVVHAALLAKRPALRERFMREARTAASVRHPNIASVFHLGGQNAGQCFYAMEFIEGETLAERVRRRGPLPALLALDVALQVAHALIAAGQADLIHRDIKPSNLMLSFGGMGGSNAGYDEGLESSDGGGSGTTTVKVIDFGLARTIKPDAGGALTAVGDFVGTPHYASPEQLAGDDDPIDVRSDIFSLGSTLWFLLTGKQPFAGRSFEEIQRLQLRKLPVEELQKAAVPEPVIGLLRAMLAPDPEDRPQTPVALAELLHRCRQEVQAALRQGGGQRLARSSSAGYATSPNRRQPPWQWAGVAVGLGVLLLVVGWAAWSIQSGHLKFTASSGEPPAAPIASDKSIAVLPFDNLSAEKDNAFFADGIQDDLLTSLAKIRDLRVISRSSVLSYRDPAARGNLREIGRALNVAHILEGSVRRSGDRVRVTVQLIDAHNDTHLWAETYDRQLSDALTIQGDLAREIVTALRATLSPEEKARVETRSTQDPDAYMLYLRGRDYHLRPDILLENFLAAEKLFEEAASLDPTFALAYARLSQVRSRIAFNYEPSVARYAGARAAAEQALRLQPELGEAHLALGLCYYYGDHDYPRSLAELGIAARALPNDTEVLRAIGYVQRRQGKWDEARASFQRAASLGPRDAPALEALARFHLDQREWPAAAQAYERAISLAPQSINARLLRAMVDFHWKGDLSRLRSALASLPNHEDPEGEAAYARYDLALLSGDYAEAERLLTQPGGRETFTVSIGTPMHRSYLQGLIYLARAGKGDAARARGCFEAARAHYEASARDFPLDPIRHVDLGQLYAALGWRDAAIGEGLYAARLRPESADAIYGSTVSLRLARVYALLGEKESALPLLEHLFTISVDEWNGFSSHDLRARPEWMALRGDARFQRLTGEN